MVIITAEGRNGLKESLFGNTTMHLMRNCPCSVWVIKPGQPRKYDRILAAVDMAQEDKDRDAFGNKFFELATSLARVAQSKFLILHAQSMYGESILRGREGVSDKSIEKLLQEIRDTHQQWMIEPFQKHLLDDLKSEVYLLKRDVGTLIIEITQ